jgi:tetratricopeptide (TPR) repeat protein/DNA-binding transcriptional ArsR family regulator
MQHSLISVFTPSLMSAEDLEHIFVQREPLAKDLIKRIVNSTKGSGKEHSLLIGMRGMGKTHMVSLVYHRIRSIPEIQDKILIAWLREEEWGVDSWLDLVMRIFRSITEDRNSVDSKVAQELLNKLRESGLEHAKESATKFLRDLIGKRTLVLIIENMDDLFQGLGDIGQQKFRAFLQEYRCCTVLATTPALFKGVTSREVPFFGFFHRSFLEPIEVDGAVKMLGQIASLNTVRDEHHALAAYLQSVEGRARVRAVHHLAGGNPRVYTLFAQFITRESLDGLVDAFIKMLDDLTPYYQSRMKELSNQQRKIVELLVDRRQAVMVKDIADTCFIDQRAVASQLRELKKKGFVVSNEVGRESFYELREVLMRFCMEVKKFRGRWVELIIDFLKIWYRPEQRQGMMERFGDSRLINRDDLERLFLSEDDPVSLVAVQEFEKSLKEQNQVKVFQIAEELYSMKIITNNKYKKIKSLINGLRYHEITNLLESPMLDASESPMSYYKLLINGLTLQGENKWEDSIAFFDQAISIKQNEQKSWNDREFLLDSPNPYKIEPSDITIKPDSYEAWYGRGISLRRLNMDEEAFASFDKTVSINPDKHEAWYKRGNSLRRLGRYKEAIESYDRAIAIKPDYHKAMYNKGSSLNNLGKYEEAIESYNQAISARPDKFEAWNNRGISLHNLQRYEEAIDSYDRAIALKSNYYEALYNKGISLYNLGRYQDAVKSYDLSIDINPCKHETWNNRGISFRRLKKYEEAISSFDQAILIKSDYYEAWYNRGVSLSKQRKYEESIESYNQAISIKSNFSQAWQSKGWTYFKWGDYIKSIDCCNQSIEISPNKYDALHNKGLVQFVASDYQSAIVTWRRAFKYIKDPKVPRYYDVSELIQEFIEELIPRFTQLSIQETLLIPLLEIYREANVITELGAALVNTLHLIVAPSISDHTAAQWLELWRTSSLGNEPAMELPLRLMNTAIEYKKDPSKRQRLWLNLPSEERPILDKALKLAD